MARQDGIKWVKKSYLFLSLAVILLIWGWFFCSLAWGRLSHGPVEETWFLEVMKWVVMTPILVGIVDGIFWSLIMIGGHVASEKADKKKDEKK